MMRNITTQLCVLLMCASLVGCSTNTREQNTVAGGATGAVIGGLAGSLIGGGTGRAIAIGVGIVAGALLGGVVGNHMDSSDNAKMGMALNQPTYRPTTWTNAKTGNTYTVAPTTRPMAMNGYSNCRKFRTTAIINGKSQTVYGTACVQKNGAWKAM